MSRRSKNYFMTWQSQKKKIESKTKIRNRKLLDKLEKHGGDTGGGQEAGSWGSSHLRSLRVVDVRTNRYDSAR